MEDIQCIFCNRSSDRIVIVENGYTGRKCPQCGLIFISPRPTLAKILNLYGHDQTVVSARSHISAAFSKRLYAKHNVRIIKKFIKTGSMLEIGAGAGYFLDEARKEGFEVYANELNTILANYIEKVLAIPCESSPLDISLFNGKKFDIIYHCNVLSHLYNPVVEFQKINDKLKKNGLVVFQTGNLGDVKEKYFKFISKFMYPDHLFFFSEDNLRELLRRTGFEFVKIHRYSILPQLMFSKMARKVMNFVKSKARAKNLDQHNPTEVPSFNVPHAHNNAVHFKQFIKNAYSCILYLIRYKIGYVIPKKQRPQTVIVVARRTN